MSDAKDVKGRLGSLPPRKRELLRKLLDERKGAPAPSTPAAADREPSSSAIRPDWDVVILGGGLAGLTLALQLRQTAPEAARILVAERRVPPAPEAAFKVGEATVEMGSFYYREVVGLIDHLKEHQLPKAGLRYFFTAGDNRDIARRVEFGAAYFPPVPSFLIDRGRFENFLREEALARGIEVRGGCSVRDVDLGSPHGITLERGAATERLTARWVVDATGRVGFLKKRLGLAAPVRHAPGAVWFRLESPIDPETWSDDASFRGRMPSGLRRLCTCHLTGTGYWVWLIPLASGGTSVGIVADPEHHPFARLSSFERALDWLHEHEPQCAAAVAERRAGLQDFLGIRRFAYGCKQVYSADRWCLTGEAGVFVDPLYSPGSDLIGLGNTYITDLIVRDLAGEPIAERAQSHNRTFLNTFESLLTVYEGQYVTLGNAQAMMAKAVWDSALYWGFLLLAFFRRRTCDLEVMARLSPALQQANLLNARMQALFRHWATARPESDPRDRFVDTLSLRFLYDLHTGLEAELDDAGLEARIAANLDLVRRVALEIDRKAREVLGSLPEGVGLAEDDLPEVLPPGMTGTDPVRADLQRIWL